MGLGSPLLGIIVVAYRDYASVDRLLLGQRLSDGLVRFVVVDNTEVESANFAKVSEWSQMQGVDAVRPPRNLGYLGGAAFALEVFPELRTLEFVAVSNSDLQYDAVELAGGLLDESSNFSGVGVVAPRLVDDSGTEVAQLHYSERPAARKYWWLSRLFSYYPLAVAHRLIADLTQRFRRTPPIGKASSTLFAPHGALMIFTREYVSSEEPFSHPSFLFCEEVFVGVQCERLGLSCCYAPRLTYSHRRHGSIGSVPSRLTVKFLRESHATMARLLADTDRA